METFRLLRDLHNLFGSSYYEIALGISAVSSLAEWYLKKQGKLDTAALCHGISLASLGFLAVHAIMRVLKMMGRIIL